MAQHKAIYGYLLLENINDDGAYLPFSLDEHFRLEIDFMFVKPCVVGEYHSIMDNRRDAFVDKGAFMFMFFRYDQTQTCFLCTGGVNVNPRPRMNWENFSIQKFYILNNGQYTEANGIRENVEFEPNNSPLRMRKQDRAGIFSIRRYNSSGVLRNYLVARNGGFYDLATKSFIKIVGSEFVRHEYQ